jgi:hypothetical protein
MAPPVIRASSSRARNRPWRPLHPTAPPPPGPPYPREAPSGLTASRCVPCRLCGESCAASTTAPSPTSSTLATPPPPKQPLRGRHYTHFSGPDAEFTLYYTTPLPTEFFFRATAAEVGLIFHRKCGTILRPRFTPIVEAGGGDSGVAEPLLERGRCAPHVRTRWWRRGAQRMHATAGSVHALRCANAFDPRDRVDRYFRHGHSLFARG